MPNISTFHLVSLAILILTFLRLSPSYVHAQPQEVRDAKSSEAQDASEVTKQKPIEEILITGQKRVKTREVRSQMKLKPGDFYSKEAAERERRRIYRMGSFDHVDYEATKTNGGITLVFRVVERPFIAAIEFRGNKRASNEELMRLVHPKKNQYLDQNLLKNDVSAIKSFYFAKGHQFAEVDASVEPLGAEGPDALKAKATYRITEGPQVRIAMVEIIGNAGYTDSDLRKLTKTKPKGLFRSGIYDEDLFKNDLRRLKGFYRNAGYVDASVTSKSDYNPQKTKMYITIEINEGEKYEVGSVTFSGNELFSNSELARVTQTKRGDPFRVKVLERDKSAILDKYGEQGYIKAEIDLSTKVQTVEDKSRVSIRFDIREGERFFIESIGIVGNRHVSGDEIKAMLTFREKERVNTNKIRESVRKLLSTGKFAVTDESSQKEPIVIEYAPGSKANAVSVIVNVVEKGE